MLLLTQARILSGNLVSCSESMLSTLEANICVEKLHVDFFWNAQQNVEWGLINCVFFVASDFEVGECWGYNRFFRLDLLVGSSVTNAKFYKYRLKWSVVS